MKKLVLVTTGKSGKFELFTVPDPKPGPGQVLVEVKAAGVNFADIMMKKGLYPGAPKLPFTPGFEAAGLVLDSGAGVSADLPDKVITLTQFGAYSNKILVPADQIFPLPECMDFVEGAALPVNFLSAWLLLVVMGSLHADETVLLHNAGGGAGLACLQIAKHIGANTIGIAGPHKHDFLKNAGIGHIISTSDKYWDQTVMNLTLGRGVDLVIDPIGGGHAKKSFQVLAPAGRLGLSGVSSVSLNRAPGQLKFLKMLIEMPKFNPVQLMNKNKGVFGLNLGNIWGEKQKLVLWLTALLEGVDQGWINPHVDRVFTFEQVDEAFKYIENRQNIGKVVLIPD